MPRNESGERKLIMIGRSKVPRPTGLDCETHVDCGDINLRVVGILVDSIHDYETSTPHYTVSAGERVLLL